MSTIVTKPGFFSLCGHEIAAVIPVGPICSAQGLGREGKNQSMQSLGHREKYSNFNCLCKQDRAIADEIGNQQKPLTERGLI